MTDEQKPLISREPRMSDEDLALLKHKLMKIVCGTADMGSRAPAEMVSVVPAVARILVEWF
ncbi:hypothetical protein GMI70_07050 [Eggerthellaceae bacterium zg-893]|nr:hypothetical protein [Eggerthellaceae bacterium zg-893]